MSGSGDFEPVAPTSRADVGAGSHWVITTLTPARTSRPPPEKIEYAQHYTCTMQALAGVPEEEKARALHNALISFDVTKPAGETFRETTYHALRSMQREERTINSVIRLTGFPNYERRMNMTAYHLFCLISSFLGLVGRAIDGPQKDARERCREAMRYNLVNTLRRKGEHCTESQLSKRMSLVLAVENCARDLSDPENTTEGVRLQNLCQPRKLQSVESEQTLWIKPDMSMYIAYIARFKTLVETAYQMCEKNYELPSAIAAKYNDVLLRTDRELAECAVPIEIEEPHRKRTRWDSAAVKPSRKEVDDKARDDRESYVRKDGLRTSGSL